MNEYRKDIGGLTHCLRSTEKSSGDLARLSLGSTQSASNRFCEADRILFPQNFFVLMLDILDTKPIGLLIPELLAKDSGAKIST